MSQPYARSAVGTAGSSAMGMARLRFTVFDVTAVWGWALGHSAVAERPDPTKCGAGSAGVTHRCLSKEAGERDGRPTDGC